MCELIYSFSCYIVRFLSFHLFIVNFRQFSSHITHFHHFFLFLRKPFRPFLTHSSFLLLPSFTQFILGQNQQYLYELKHFSSPFITFLKYNTSSFFNKPNISSFLHAMHSNHTCIKSILFLVREKHNSLHLKQRSLNRTHFHSSITLSLKILTSSFLPSNHTCTQNQYCFYHQKTSLLFPLTQPNPTSSQSVQSHHQQPR